MKVVAFAVAATAMVFAVPVPGTASTRGPLQVLFVAERDGDADIYAADAGGRAVTAVTVNSLPDLSAVASPTGDRIAVSRRDTVVILDLRARTSRVVAPGFPDAWSPDGKLLAFADARTRGLSVVSASGRGVRRLTRGGPSYDAAFDVSWSGDSRRLTYDGSDGDMYLVDVRKGTRRHIDVIDDTSAVWSGQRFSYINDTGPGARIDLIVRDARGRVVRRVPSEDFYSSQWSPDGKRIAWAANGTGPGVFVGVGWTKPRSVTRGHSIAGPEPYVWAPDSTRFAFVAGRGAASAVWVAKADGSSVRRLRSTAGTTTALPSWSPDSHMLAFVRSGQLDVVPADGAGSVTVLAHGRHIRILGWRAARTVGTLPTLSPPRGPETARGNTLVARGHISELAAAGTRVAFLVPGGSRDGCEHISVWDVATGKIVRFRTPCAVTEQTSFYGLHFDGQRADWSGIAWHNDAYQRNGHASLAAPQRAYVSPEGADLGANYEVKAPVKHVVPQTAFGYSLRADGSAIAVSRVKDGQRRTIRPPAVIVDAVLASGGVFYTYSVGGTQPGRVVYVPYGSVFR